VPEAVAAPVEEAAPAEEEEIPAWLRILREEGLEEPTLEEAPAEEEAVAEAEVPEAKVPSEAMVMAEEAPMAEELPLAEREEEIPDWLLRVMREEGVEEPALEEALAEEVMAEAAPVEEAALTEEEIPAWLRILREEGLEEPTLEEALTAEEVLAEAEVMEAETVPTEEETPAWLRIMREEEPEEAPVGEVIAEAVEPSEVERIEEVPTTIAECEARLKTNPNDYETRLSLARAYHKEGDRGAAFDQYGKLIRSGRLLEMVIEDLEQVSGDAPSQSTVLHLLGDAYVKTGHLQKALESYQEALARL
jgi:tetratricopeptide (TPR) repeat protein